MERYKNFAHLHFDVKQMKIGQSRGVLLSFTRNYVKYANIEGFYRDSHIYHEPQYWFIIGIDQKFRQNS